MVLAAIVAEGGCDARNRTSDPLPDSAGSVSLAWVGDMVCGPVAPAAMVPDIQRASGQAGEGIDAAILAEASSAVAAEGSDVGRRETDGRRTPDPGGGGGGAAYPQDAEFTEGRVTHYGESYNGQQLGCPGSGLYSSANPGIIAVGPADYGRWPCGVELNVCGPGGCITGWRIDACPGCGVAQLDLSEAGFAAVCGPEASGSCKVTIGVSDGY